MASVRIALLFGIDGLLSTGGAGAASWRLAFDELYGVSADRGEVIRIDLGRARLVYGEAPTPEQAIVVGDTPNDIEGAHAAGIRCVAVVSHHFNVEQLREAGADYAIGSLEEALAL